MAEVSVTRTINAPVEAVWASLDDFGNIDRFNPNLSRSFLINGSEDTGLGATRQCDLSDGKNYIQERVISYEPNKLFEVEIYNGTVPLKTAFAKFNLRPLGPNKTEVTMAINFIPKMGLLGKLMVPMMRPQFRKQVAALLDGNKAYVENGVEIARTA